MSNKIETVTGAEWNVMRVVWSLHSASTNTIIAKLRMGSDWKDSTVKTLLGRLIKKGLLTNEKDGRQFVYQATIPEQVAMNQTAQEMFNHLCSMKQGQTLIDLVQNNAMTKQDLDELQQVITEKRKTAPDKIDCNCLPDGSCH